MRTSRSLARAGWLGRIAILATALTLVGFTTTGAAMAAVQKPHHHPSPSGIAIPAAGDNWDYQGFESGNCGTATVVGDYDGGGKMIIQGQLVTEDGEAITGGTVTFIWSWPGGGGRKSWEPKNSLGNWISPQMSFTAPLEVQVTVLLTGFIITPDGDCSIENPHFTTNPLE